MLHYFSARIEIISISSNLIAYPTSSALEPKTANRNRLISETFPIWQFQVSASPIRLSGLSATLTSFRTLVTPHLSSAHQ